MSTEFKAADTPVEDWIDGVSYLQADVTIYRNPAILAEYRPVIDELEELYERLDELTDAAEDTDEDPEKPLSGPDATLSSKRTPTDASLADKPQNDPAIAEVTARIKELEGVADELLRKFKSDTEVWTLRKLEDHEAESIRAEVGEVPLPPAKLPVKASKTMREKHVQAYLKFEQDMRDYSRRFNLRAVALCVLKVAVNGDEKPAPTREDMERVAKRPGGEEHLSELVAALEKLSAEGVSIVAPHRRRA